jgi:hypothetical protein
VWRQNEVQNTRLATAFMVPANLYSYGLALKGPLSADFFGAIIKVMLKLVAFVQRGISSFPKKDWIKTVTCVQPLTPAAL